MQHACINTIYSANPRLFSGYICCIKWTI